MPRPALLLLPIALALALPRIPFEWTHRLSEGCEWHSRGSLGLLSAPGAKADRLQAACWAHRGLASPSPFVITLRRKFPSEAELTAWRSEP